MIETPVLLENQVQPYAWGSTSAIQNLLNAGGNDDTPWAELWIGAHPKAPSNVILNNEKIPLDTLVRRYPEKILGAEAAGKFDGTLPFLFKVLAAAQPLSIQAHPDKTMAKDGFDRENRLAIPMDAPHRNYRDPWPKPEVICAVEPFVALNGFRPAESIIEWFEAFCPEALSEQIQMLKKSPDESGIQTMFKSLIRMAPERKNMIVDTAAVKAAQSDTMEADWVARLSRYYPGDIGVLSPLFLNIVQLEPATAMFLPPGRMHAYLEGVGIELMANSDNVLRGGLTGKHVDPEELMRAVRFSPSSVEILRPVAKNSWERYYDTPAEAFVLSVMHSDKQNNCRSSGDHGLEILLCMDGRTEIVDRSQNTTLPVTKGQSVLIPACAGPYEIQGEGWFFKASIPGRQ